jgi:hypothetical protein
MKRILTIITIAVTSFVLGAGCMYMVKRQPRPKTDEWITVIPDTNPMGYATAALVEDVPTPWAESLTGKVKFVNHDNGIQLGYVLKIPIKPVLVSTLPGKYRKSEKLANGFTVGPPDKLNLEGHYIFTLKDSDGFVLQKLSSPDTNLETGTDNPKQSMTETTIAPSVAERTKSVVVEFLVTKCYPCG